MQPVKAILFEPVGCLAEFPPEPFLEIAARLFGRKKKPTRSGSRAYWHLLNLLESHPTELAESDRSVIEDLENEAVDGANVYEDVVPALSQLETMGVHLSIATSLSNSPSQRFAARCGGQHFFTAICNKDNAGGIKAEPLRHALRCGQLHPQETIFLTDTAEGLNVATTVGAAPILVMNDPDEARRLVFERQPAGGIVSLHELPDFIRFVRAAVLRSEGGLE